MTLRDFRNSLEITDRYFEGVSVIRFLPLLAVIALAAMPARAERGFGGGGGGFALSVLGGFSIAHDKSVGAGQIDSQMGLAFGFGADFRILPNMTLEVDILNVEKNFDLLQASGTKEALPIR